MTQRIGFGFDSHALKEGIPLVIGGVEIIHEKGALGHSDADVLIHAICDALLGAAALGDIGTHFSDTDPLYKGINSALLLEKCNKMLKEEWYEIANIDCTICIEKPKIAPYIHAIQNRLAEIMGIIPAQISVKAKTSEKLGFIGREEGLSAYAVVLLESAL